MSRTLRRPMFRGGPISSEGTGITSGLDNPRQGYADGPDDQGVQPSFLDNIYYALNPPTSEILKRLQERQKQEPLMDKISKFLTTGVPASELTYRTEAEKQEAIRLEKEKEQKLKPEIKPEEKPEEKITEVTKKQDFKTIYDDLLPIFKSAIGPDQDQYTRQKYLELAKFGLNLLKPTPAGVKPSLLTSVATAAEKPLEGYGAIIEKERQAAKVPEMLALQEAVKLSEPGTLGKALRDMVRSGAAKDEKEALKLYLKGDSAAQRKETMAEKELLASKIQTYLPKAEPQIIDKLASLTFEDPSLLYKIKGDRAKYKTYEEGAIYIDKGKIVKYKNGQFYTPDEKGFK